MTKEARNDVLICALVISVAVHVGAMFWARPKVMTTVAAGASRVQFGVPPSTSAPLTAAKTAR